MSALAKKMMEKYGWKEGEGLGKERSGMKSYVKVVRRDPNVATGLGHAADPAQGGSLASTHAVELDALYGQLHKDTKKKAKKRPRSNSSNDDDVSGESISTTQHSSSSNDSTSDSSGSDSEVEEKVSKGTEKAPRRRQRDSSSDSDSDSEDAENTEKHFKGEAVGDVTRMTDKDLFQRCGGVRLGRAGRHRFFDGKLKRIHGSP